MTKKAFWVGLFCIGVSFFGMGCPSYAGDGSESDSGLSSVKTGHRRHMGGGFPEIKFSTLSPQTQFWYKQNSRQGVEQALKARVMKTGQFAPNMFLKTGIAVSYDARSTGKVPPVRDQGDLGTCWAFGAMGSMESNYYDTDQTELSPYYHNYFAYTIGNYPAFTLVGGDIFQEGGNDYMSMALLTRHTGAMTA